MPSGMFLPSEIYFNAKDLSKMKIYVPNVLCQLVTTMGKKSHGALGEICALWGYEFMAWYEHFKGKQCTIGDNFIIKLKEQWCHMHKNNQDKRISQRHEPTVTNIGLVLSSNTKHENKNTNCANQLTWIINKLYKSVVDEFDSLWMKNG